MIIKPLDDKIIVEVPAEVDESDKVHLIQLLNTKDKVVCSKIVAVGPGKVTDKGKHIPMEYVPGDVVFYPAEAKKNSPRFKVDGVEYMTIIQEMVLCYRPKAVVEAAEQQSE